ncbi:RidA family protein [Nocardioides sp. BGMRC 2183]|nr:RidA family protein [Nocardioides sp. BGMRC 2183]
MTGPIPISAHDAPAAIGPYVHAVRHGDLLFCSGSLPLDPATGELRNDSLAQEAEASLQNLQAVCAAAGTDLTNALRMTVYTTDLGGFAEINEAYAAFFASWAPARTTIGVAALPRDARVEIDAIVALPSAGPETSAMS